MPLGLRRVGGSPGFYRRLLTKFADANAAFVEDFRGALGSDREAARRAAHTLKSTAGSIGAEALRAVAGELEQAVAQSAEPALIEGRLGELAALLDPLLASLAALDRPDTAASAAASDATSEAPGAVPAGARELAALAAESLEGSETTAIEQLVELAERLAGTGWHDLARRAAASADDLDFEAAASRLRELMAALERQEGHER